MSAGRCDEQKVVFTEKKRGVHFLALPRVVFFLAGAFFLVTFLVGFLAAFLTTFFLGAAFLATFLVAMKGVSKKFWRD